MIPENLKAIIELGNINIKCIIFNIKSDIPEILSTSKASSEGIHNGVIVNPTKASNAIRLCIGEAEKKANVSLKKINVVIEQSEFLCTKFSKERKIDGSKIHKEDIEFLLKEAKKQVVLNDERQSIIHIFNHNYLVDGKMFVEEPIDVYADHLSHEMTFVTMPKNNIKNIKQVFINCDIEIERFISSIFALAANLLDNNDLQFGSTLIDIGFEKISLGLFKNFALIHSTTFPIGINHIIKDISKVCSLSLEESEVIKNNIDFSFQDNSKIFDNGYLKDNFFSNSNFRKISESLLINVVKTRVDEIFKLIKKQMELMETNSSFEKRIFIVGGGSNIKNLKYYCDQIFGSNFNKLKKSKENNNKEKISDDFNACLGALKIIVDGWETEAIPETTYNRDQKIGFLAKFSSKQ